MQVVRLSALRTTGTHCCQRKSRPQGHSAAGRTESLKNSNDTVRYGIRDLPACSALPEPTALPRAPIMIIVFNFTWFSINIITVLVRVRVCVCVHALFVSLFHLSLRKRELEFFLCICIQRNMDLQEVGGGCEDWMELAQDRDRWRALVSTVMNLRVPKMRGIS